VPPGLADLGGIPKDNNEAMAAHGSSVPGGSVFFAQALHRVRLNFTLRPTHAYRP
jgi:hypothetical protein